MPARQNEERIPMVQFESQNRKKANIHVLIGKNIKNGAVVFLILMICGIVAYGQIVFAWYFFNNKLDTTGSSTSTPSFISESTESWMQYTLYVIIFVSGGLAANGVATIRWYLKKKHTWNPDNPSTSLISKAAVTDIKQKTTPLCSSLKADKATLRLPSPNPVDLSRNFVSSKFRIVGFYDGFSSQEIRESQLQKLTHIIFSSIDMTAKGAISFYEYRIRKRFLDLIEKSRRVNPELKIIISIGQNTDPSNFDSVASNSDYRKALADSILKFIQTHKIDGIDLNWQWPMRLENRETYVLLLKEIRQRLTNSRSSQSTNPFLLTVIMPNIDNWPGFKETLDLNGILEYVDFMNIQTVYYYGFFEMSWGAYTGPSSPLYSGLGAFEDSNVDWTMTYFKQETGKPNQLNMGVPFHGIHWRNVEGPIDDKEEMWFTAKSRTEDQNDFEGSFIPWRDLEKNGWDVSTAIWHQDSRTSFIWNAETEEFVGIENERSLVEKMNYARDHGIGGITIWSVEMDDDSDTLLNSVLN